MGALTEEDEKLLALAEEIRSGFSAKLAAIARRLAGRVEALEEAVLYAMHDDNWRRVHDLELKWPDRAPTAPTDVEMGPWEEAGDGLHKIRRPLPKVILTDPAPTAPREAARFDCLECGEPCNTKVCADCLATRSTDLPTGKETPQTAGNVPSGKAESTGAKCEHYWSPNEAHPTCERCGIRFDALHVMGTTPTSEEGEP